MKAIMRNKEEMKASGIEWCERVPNSWCQIRLKDVYDFEKGKNAQIYTKDYIGLNQGIYPVYSGQTESGGIMGYINSYDYDLDECLFSTTVGAKVMTARILMGKFSLSQNCLIMNRCGDINNHFVFYMLHPLFEYEKSMIPTYMQPSLRIEDLKQYRFYAPILKEQQAIATYLDDRCGKIDAIIAEAKASIEEYKELKQAVIYEAVTKGLDKNVEMKHYNDWFDKCPSNWEYKQIRYLYELRDERNFEPLSEVNLISLYTDQGVIQHADIEKTSGNKAVTADGYKKVYPEDIVVNIILCWMGAMGRSEYQGVTSPAYDVYKPIGGSKVCSRYYHYLFRTDRFSKKCYTVGRGIMMMRWRTYSSQFRTIKVPVPPYNEQIEIANYLDKRISRMEELINAKKSLIEDLESYKKSLIYEVVTGKRKVVE